jgi:LysM repeat protein
MNNPNPFVPQGSLLEQQSQRRFRLKFAVGCVLAVSVTGLVVMLIQGCKRETPPDSSLNTDTNSSAMLDNTNTSVTTTNEPTYAPPVPTNTAYVAPPVAVEPAAGTEYEIVKGDTLDKIARKHGVTLKALQAANPTADSKHLKIKQKITIPAPTKSTEAVPAMGAADAGGEIYVVKSNDNLGRIARGHGITLKALKAANNLTTDHIKVGQKLKIPSKTETAPAAPMSDTAPAPMVSPAPAPVK